MNVLVLLIKIILWFNIVIFLIAATSVVGSLIQIMFID